MASYVDLTSEEISAGEPTRQELFTKIKCNFSNHQDRIVTLEGSIGFFSPFVFNRQGAYSQYGATTNATGVERVTFSLTVNAVRLYIDIAGASGTTEIDILRKIPAGSFESILTTKASVAFGAGDDVFSTNAVLDATKVDQTPGTILRLDITSVQGGTVFTGPRGLTVFVEYEKT